MRYGWLIQSPNRVRNKYCVKSVWYVTNTKDFELPKLQVAIKNNSSIKRPYQT